jgi:hypothetical protein
MRGVASFLLSIVVGAMSFSLKTGTATDRRA